MSRHALRAMCYPLTTAELRTTLESVRTNRRSIETARIAAVIRGEIIKRENEHHGRQVCHGTCRPKCLSFLC